MKQIFYICFCIFVAFSSFANEGFDEKPVLSKEDITRYQKIFSLQEKERWSEADSQIKQLHSKILMGHVLAQRYIESVTWKTKGSEIRAWFSKYSKQTEAPRMYKLAKIKKVRLRYRKPKSIYGSGTGACTSVIRREPIDDIQNPSFYYLSHERRKIAKKLMRKIYIAVLNRKTLTAKRLLTSKEAKNLFSIKVHDSAWIALGFAYFLDAKDKLALEVLTPAVKRSGKNLPLGLWVAGLASWRLGEYEKSVSYFEDLVSHRKANALLKAGGAFWASRVHLKLGHLSEVNSFLEKGREYPRTFYGLLSARALGEDLTHTWVQPSDEMEEENREFISPDLKRILALKEVGKDTLAEREMAQLYLRSDASIRSALSFISTQKGIAKDLSSITGQMSSFGRSRYPAPDWKPLTGWQVDKALMFAFARQESCFNPRAKSSMGALGIMQLMPSTAREMAKKMGIKWERDEAFTPEYNLALGQAYLLKLFQDKKIKDNLIFLAVAYNSGPGNLYKWQRRIKFQNDPLLFIESIPSRETRAFVERIVSNYWIYRSLFNQPTYSLDNVISGHWPTYKAFDEVK
ncbi:MAG: lytic transglycosylase domain-containing protein [Alphaproteobacteria bacterium]|nr:lytic transglycosylase domain-containing protein [Alphaproteobacteria bacterium]